MNKKLYPVLVLAISVIALMSTASGASALSVKGYYKSNGTYVSPYNRTSPNSTRYDNYSTRGNTNPYTGSTGYKSPTKSYSSSSYGSSSSSYGSSSYNSYKSYSSPSKSYGSSSYSSYGSRY